MTRADPAFAARPAPSAAAATAAAAPKPRPAKRSPTPLSAALAKRARRAGARSAAPRHAAELAEILLARGGGIGLEDIEREYSPRAVELLARIAAGLGGGDDGMDDDHDDDEEDEDEDEDEDEALVPGCEKIEEEAGGEQCVPGMEIESLTEGSEGGGEGEVYKAETELALSRIFDLGKVAAVAHPTVAPTAPYAGPSVVTMTGFGELGRFGNQVLQYAFLRCYRARWAIDEVQVPAWVGKRLFGLADRAVQRALPAVVETKDAKANSTFTGDFMDYIRDSNAGDEVKEVAAVDLVGEGIDQVPLVNVDFWGWFQWHTSCYAAQKHLVQTIFTPVQAIEAPMVDAFDSALRWKAGVRRTVVGLHLRLGDYQSISASSFGYCAPTSWYLEWLENIWPTLENPVLFVASDDLDAVLRDFAAYSPLTADAAGIVLPPAADGLKAAFFPDWWSLTQCDVLAISNSTFSFSASMVNRVPGARFFRAHFADRIVQIDPWAADPIVHRDMSSNGLTAAVDTLKVVYNTQGTRGVVRNVLYEMPCYGVRAVVMKALLWNNARKNVVEAVAKKVGVRPGSMPVATYFQS